MNAHRSCIKLNRSTPIGIHFNSINHNITHLQVTPIEQLKTDNITDRRGREFFWQLQLGTIFPKGLNSFPVLERLKFQNLNICSFTDLELFDTLTCLENHSSDID